MLTKALRTFLENPESVTKKGTRRTQRSRIKKKALSALKDLEFIALHAEPYFQEKIFTTETILPFLAAIIYIPWTSPKKYRREIVKDIRLWNLCLSFIELGTDRGTKLVGNLMNLMEKTGFVLHDNVTALLKIDYEFDINKKRKSILKFKPKTYKFQEEVE